MNKQGPGKIDWTDYAWNPVTGCKHECFYCYARAGYRRQGMDFEPAIHHNRLVQPLGRKKPSKIFVCSMADLFGDWVPGQWIEAVMQTVNSTPQHTFQFLTKNPKRLVFSGVPWPDNAWVGATATDRISYRKAIDGLADVRARVKFISFEPLLGPTWVGQSGDIQLVNWVIIGALTGRHASSHPLKRWWIDELVEWASWHKIPVWEKDSLAPIMDRPLKKEMPNGP